VCVCVCVLTSAVETWRAVKIWKENLIEVPNGFLPLTYVPPMIQMKTQILNLKMLKTQIPMRYLTLKQKLYFSNAISNKA